MNHEAYEALIAARQDGRELDAALAAQVVEEVNRERVVRAAGPAAGGVRAALAAMAARAAATAG